MPILNASGSVTLMRQNSIDACFAGIGENAHLAFNDPPSDFVTDEPDIVVNLDADCRRERLARAGSRRSMLCRIRQSRCQSGKSSLHR